MQLAGAAHVAPFASISPKHMSLVAPLQVGAEGDGQRVQNNAWQLDHNRADGRPTLALGKKVCHVQAQGSQQGSPGFRNGWSGVCPDLPCFVQVSCSICVCVTYCGVRGHHRALAVCKCGVLGCLCTPQ